MRLRGPTGGGRTTTRTLGLMVIGVIAACWLAFNMSYSHSAVSTSSSASSASSSSLLLPEDMMLAVDEEVHEGDDPIPSSSLPQQQSDTTSSASSSSSSSPLCASSSSAIDDLLDSSNEDENIHARLAGFARALALRFSCHPQQAKTRSFARLGNVNNRAANQWAAQADGKLFVDYLVQRGWEEHTGRSAAKHDADLLLLPCHYLPRGAASISSVLAVTTVNGVPVAVHHFLDELKARFGITSTARGLSALSQGKTWYEAVRDRFLFMGCSYRDYMPEVVYMRSRDTCLFSTKQLQAKLADTAPGGGVAEMWRRQKDGAPAPVVVSTKQLLSGLPRDCDVMLTGAVGHVFAQRHFAAAEGGGGGQMLLLVSSFFPDARAWSLIAQEDDVMQEDTRAKLKLAALQTFKIIQSKLQSRERGAFAVLAVSYVLQEGQGGGVLITSVDCDAKLHTLPHGELAMERLMDVVVASNLDPVGFNAPFNQFAAQHAAELRSAPSSTGGPLWELLYSENPRFEFASANVC